MFDSSVPLAHRCRSLAAGVGLAVMAAVQLAAVAGAADSGPPIEGPVQKFTVTEPPVPMAAFSFSELGGTEVTIADFAGKVVLLNLWATWCAPCVRELPALERLNADLGGEEFQVVALSVDRGGSHHVVPFLERHGLTTLPVYLDEAGRSLTAVKIRGFPTTMMVDRAGREVGRLEGDALWDFPEAKALVQYYIDAGGN